MTMKEGTYKVEVDPDGNERWYDSNRRLIHEKDTDGYEYWYDSKGNTIHVKYSNGYEYWYDPNGKRITKEEFNGNLIREVTPYDDWPIDAPVIVHNEGNSPEDFQKRHWAGVRGGWPSAWMRGRTSHTATNEGDWATWDYAKLAEDVE